MDGWNTNSRFLLGQTAPFWDVGMLDPNLDISIGDKVINPSPGWGFIGPHEIRIPVIKGGMSLSPIWHGSSKKD